MVAMAEQSESEEPARAGGKRNAVRAANLALWVLVVAWQVWATAREPSLVNISTAIAFVLLLGAVNAQIFLVRWLGERRLTRSMARMHGSAYLSELDNLPNRNYLLSELRREMPRARATNSPFVLIILSMDSYADICERRGEDFGQRSLRGLAQVLKRFTRTSDFVAHLGGPQFCVLLNDCRHEDAFVYLQRVPGTIAVSDGRRMFEVPVTARLMPYDLENLYATDVLRDAEESKPLRRKEVQHYGSEAA
jgi:diguanylate cyclase (GGDEF)-like protein